MQAYRIDPLGDPRWGKLIGNHRNASVFHTREWLDSIHRTFGYKPVVYTTSSPRAELTNGIVFCGIRSWLTGSRLVSLPFSDHCEPLVDSADEQEFLVNCLRAEMEHRDWTYLEFRPVYWRFEQGGRELGLCPADSYYLHRLDLRPTLDDIFHSLHKDSVQRRIQRAKRADISCKSGRSEELLRDFYALQVSTRKRHHLPPQPYVWFRNLAQSMAEALNVRVAYKNNLPIAAALTLRFRNAAYYKYGCSDARFHNLGAIPALLWDAIQEAKAAGCEEFDLGRSDCQNEKLIAFKNHWTQERTSLVYWRYPAPDETPLANSWKLRVAKRAFAYMPKRLLSMTGRLLYRHMG